MTHEAFSRVEIDAQLKDQPGLGYTEFEGLRGSAILRDQ
jgi:hypothetical protein